MLVRVDCLRHPLSFAPKLKKPNPPKFQKAKSPQKAVVKFAAMPKNSLSEAKHGAQAPTTKPKAPRPKTPANPKSPKRQTPKSSEKCDSQIETTNGPFQGQHFVCEGVTIC